MLRNFTKLYEFRNNTYFLFVRLRILTDHVFTLFYLSKKLRKLTDCEKHLLSISVTLRNFHGSRKPASFWFSARLKTSHIVQQRVPSISKRPIKGCISSNNNPRTKLGYDMLHQHFLGDHVVQLVVHHFHEFDDQLVILDYQQQFVECQSCVVHHPFELEGDKRNTNIVATTKRTWTINKIQTK